EFSEDFEAFLRHDPRPTTLLPSISTEPCRAYRVHKAASADLNSIVANASTGKDEEGVFQLPRESTGHVYTQSCLTSRIRGPIFLFKYVMPTVGSWNRN